DLLRLLSNGTTQFSVGPTGNLSSSGTLRLTTPVTNPTLSFTATGSLRSTPTDVVSNAAYSFDTTNTLSLAKLFLVFNNGTERFAISRTGGISASATLYMAGTGTSTFVGNVNVQGELEVGGHCTEVNGACADIAEKYAASEDVGPGDVVEIDSTAPKTDGGTPVVRLATVSGARRLLGVVSTSPGITLANKGVNFGAANYGSPRAPNVALAGRVPVKVAAENGPIEIGDPLTASSIAGVAALAQGGVRTIGYALEPFDGPGIGSILVFVSLGYGPATNASLTAASGADLSGIATLTPEGELDFGGRALVNVGGIRGANGRWAIDGDGNLTTRGAIATELETTQGLKKLYSLGSPDAEFILSGSAELSGGEARVVFAEPLPEIIDPGIPIRVIVTMTSETPGVYVAEKGTGGFTVRERAGGGGVATFDWIAVVRRVGFGATATSTPTGIIPSTTTGGSIDGGGGPAIDGGNGGAISTGGGSAFGGDGGAGTTPVTSDTTSTTATDAPVAPTTSDGTTATPNQSSQSLDATGQASTDPGITVTTTTAPADGGTTSTTTTPL
ncbi:MAG: hypothetical protein AAB562_01950, partial [Patescibacteria group bacterium]